MPTIQEAPPAQLVRSVEGWAQARHRSAFEASESGLLRNRLTPPRLVRLRRRRRGERSHDLDNHRLGFRLESLVYDQGSPWRCAGLPEYEVSEGDRHQNTGQGDDEGQTVPTVQGIDGRTSRGEQRGRVAGRYGPEDRYRERSRYLLGHIDDARTDTRILGGDPGQGNGQQGRKRRCRPETDQQHRREDLGEVGRMGTRRDEQW